MSNTEAVVPPVVRSDEDSGVVIPESLESWKPKTELGRMVKSGQIRDASQVYNAGLKVVESQITDILLPNMDSDLLMIGQSKGKFGGGQRRAFKQTQKKTNEGNKPSFSTYAVVGNCNGYVGLGWGKAKETVPAREKAVRDAKLNVIYVPRGSGSWQTAGITNNSIPFKITGKCGSIRITLIPAPVGTGLVVEKECAKIIGLAGIRDVWSRVEGCTATKINLVKACFDALRRLSMVKVSIPLKEQLGMTVKSQPIAAPTSSQGKSGKGRGRKGGKRNEQRRGNR